MAEKKRQRSVFPPSWSAEMWEGKWMQKSELQFCLLALAGEGCGNKVAVTMLWFLCVSPHMPRPPRLIPGLFCQGGRFIYDRIRLSSPVFPSRLPHSLAQGSQKWLLLCFFNVQKVTSKTSPRKQKWGNNTSKHSQLSPGNTKEQVGISLSMLIHTAKFQHSTS